MTTAYTDEIIRTLNTELGRILTCLDMLSDDQIWRRLKPNMNSVGHLCVHLAGNERQHFISGIGQEPNIRERTLEFTVEHTYTREQLKQLLSLTREQSLSVLSGLSEKDGDRPVFVPYSEEDWHAMKDRSQEEAEPGYTRPLQIILMQVCEHYGYHTGQIVLLTKLLQDEDRSISGYKH
ncbi:DinB family protein [Paenibacillus kobensis]|uniref:DinB family protein n=1 Tax=Paenibacillus kobensis TaxID=59841 RepID=UPI000FDC09D5|nr:DinB family protein [Paenibacillus kobensis]